MKRILCILMVFVVTCAAWAQPVSEMTIRDYVNAHKGMAVQEMKAYKIPASITLAQAIYASKAGTNRLAKEANNHFGITCHANEWEGDTFYETEDRNPDLCYRKYDKVESSYRDHSLFIAKRPRYASLFELPMTDYRAWAHGLKEAGYAGNPRYADTLIAIIQKYDLAKYDMSDTIATTVSEPVQKAEKQEPEGISQSERKTEVQQETVSVPKTNEQPVEKFSAKEEVKPDFPTITPRTVDNVFVFVLDPYNVPFKQAYYPYTRRPVYENNKTKFLIAKAGDTYASLATSLQLTEKNLRLYNDVYDNSEPVEGEVVYLEMKSTKSPVDYHILREKDTYHYISQLYGVQLKIILKRNSGSMKNYTEGDRICVGCK
ncbi:MAG: glucosaminidase domain-containing protein [Bacteroidales bacterium]|nr:glucosaminidase domain-containing protein [Bacteroidales bacterium]